ncbi:protein of unknown function [Methylotuvimicrobium alcaliphilum 20Z]|uniref:Uncharacterized protein n=1 Tax=Methylotuvimicrobium alcaliphilum (strain DSM 19304 / NCIMB 14124 / VKM B-2133 / 20Z) TaxID=1091494 RepID=G4ST01_META2|nr:protein of unknown function [Methylotuvimicrobium alcaliphilum 20Z]
MTFQSKRETSRRCPELIQYQYIPFALQISALAYGGAWVFDKGFDSMDAIIEPTWTYLRRPLTDTPAPKFD